MRCLNCGNCYIEQSGTLRLHDNRIGDYEVENVKYAKCKGCENILYPEETVLKIEEREKLILDALLRQRPIIEWVPAAETIKILEMTKQAFHKHKRIKKGFIYSLDYYGKKLYLKKSVLLFKAKKDGRFLLKEDGYLKAKSIFVFPSYTANEMTNKPAIDPLFGDLIQAPGRYSQISNLPN